MNHTEFEQLCDSIYDLSKDQRVALLQVLNSRLWLYESDEFNVAFERLNEYDRTTLRPILRECSIETLAYALKGSSDVLRSKLLRGVSRASAAKVRKLMVKLGPVRLTEVERAQASILEVFKQRAEAGKIELPPAVETFNLDLTVGALPPVVLPVKSEDAEDGPPTAPRDMMDYIWPSIFNIVDDCPRLIAMDSGKQSLTFSALECSLELHLDDHTLSKVAAITAPYRVDTTGDKPTALVYADARRLQIRPLYYAHDWVFTELMTEVGIDHCFYFLCYINDPRLTRKVLAFNPPAISRKLLKRFALYCQGKPKGLTPEVVAQKGEVAMHKILKQMQYWINEGQLNLPYMA